MAFDFESPEGNSMTCMSVRELHILGLPPHANCAGSIVSCARALDTRVAHMSHHTIYRVQSGTPEPSGRSILQYAPSTARHSALRLIIKHYGWTWADYVPTEQGSADSHLVRSRPAGTGSMIRMAVDLATGRCILDHATTTLETGGVRGGVWAFLFLWGLGRFRARDRGSAAVGLTLVPALLHQFPPAHRPGPGAQPQGPGARARLGPRASVITYLCADYRVHGLESAAERPVRDTG
jgi:hypothetical protein